MQTNCLLHFLDGNFRGEHGNPFGIMPEQCDEKFFDYVFLSPEEQPPAEGCKVSKDIIDKLRNEFEYFYPMDLRVSGKDLIPNHLTYCLYNHVAIWDDISKYGLLSMRHLQCMLVFFYCINFSTT